MTYIFFIIAFFLGVVWKKSKPVFFFQLFVIFIFFAGSSNNADYLIYQYRFNEYVLLANETEPLFTQVIKYSHYLRIDYRGFLTISALVYTMVLGIFASKYAKNPCFALSLYLIF